MIEPTDAVRPARPADVPAILRLVRALAEYEREPDAVAATEEDFHEALFPTSGAPTAFADVAEVEARGRPEIVGIAVWHLTFSTWTGRPGMWLEDLFVSPGHRGRGLGLALLRELAARCLQRGYPRLEWSVLDWNEPSIAFYRGLGARSMHEWTVNRVDGSALAALGSPAAPDGGGDSSGPAPQGRTG